MSTRWAWRRGGGRRRWRGSFGLLFIAGLLLLRLGWVAISEAGPAPPRHLDSMPWHALREGYGLYRFWERGRALRWWTPPVADPAGALLIDTWHTRKQPWDARLDPTSRRYDDMHGLGRAFDPVRNTDVPIRELGGRFTWDAPGALDGASALFINLPSGDGPGFRWSEVRAIVAFVKSGGGLLLLTDHTNCYGHADMLAQLAGELGFALPAVGALNPEHGLGERAKTWFESETLGDHAVVEGVRTVGWMTPGSVWGFATLASTGRDGWADRSEPERRDDSSGFSGNLEQDAAEESRPVPLAAAGEVGKGRVVVLGDQNAFGATMIGYADNQRLFTNALEWLLRREVEPIPSEVATWGEGGVDAYEGGFRSLQVALARRGRDEFGIAGGGTAPLRVLLPGAYDTQDAGAIVRRALVLDSARKLRSPLRWEDDVTGVDDADQPVFAQHGNRLHVPAHILTNASLGGERDDPTDPRFAEGNEVLDRALDWLFADDD